MPKVYEAIKAKLLAKGYKESDAKKHAAMIFNAGRPKGAKPVTNHGD